MLFYNNLFRRIVKSRCVACKKVKLYTKDGSQEDLVINSKITCTDSNIIYCISCTKQSGACAKGAPTVYRRDREACQGTVRKADWYHHQPQPIRHNPPRGGTLPATWAFPLRPAVPTNREGPR